MAKKVGLKAISEEEFRCIAKPWSEFGHILHDTTGDEGFQISPRDDIRRPGGRVVCLVTTVCRKLHGNWSILENIALLRGFRLGPVLTKADVSTEDRLHLNWKVNKTEKFSNEPLLEPF